MHKRYFTEVLVGISNSTHSLLHNKEVVALGEDEDIGYGHGGTVLKFELYVVDTAHVEGGSWLPCSSLGAEVEHVHVSRRSVGPLHHGLCLTEEQSGKIGGPAAVAVQS